MRKLSRRLNFDIFSEEVSDENVDFVRSLGLSIKTSEESSKKILDEIDYSDSVKLNKSILGLNLNMTGGMEAFASILKSIDNIVMDEEDGVKYSDVTSLIEVIRIPSLKSSYFRSEIINGISSKCLNLGFGELKDVRLISLLENKSLGISTEVSISTDLSIPFGTDVDIVFPDIVTPNIDCSVNFYAKIISSSENIIGEFRKNNILVRGENYV